jgi:hypothetical protein
MLVAFCLDIFYLTKHGDSEIDLVAKASMGRSLIPSS